MHTHYIMCFNLQSAFISMISFNLHANPMSMGKAIVISPFVQTLKVFYEAESIDW